MNGLLGGEDVNILGCKVLQSVDRVGGRDLIGDMTAKHECQQPFIFDPALECFGSNT